ncbi:hypothetical protein Tco_0675365 [Tanacetum coccineum]
MVTIYHLSQITTQSKRRGFSQLKVNLDNSRDDQQDGKDKLVKSSTLIGSLKPRELKEAQESPLKGSSQPEGEHIKKDKGKNVMSLEEPEKESTNSDSDDETHKLEEDVKAEAAKQEGEVRKTELVDLLGPEMGPITLKVYKEDGTSEVIPNFKASDLHLGEWRDVVKASTNRTGK